LKKKVLLESLETPARVEQAVELLVQNGSIHRERGQLKRVARPSLVPFGTPQQPQDSVPAVTAAAPTVESGATLTAEQLASQHLGVQFGEPSANKRKREEPQEELGPSKQSKVEAATTDDSTA